MTSQPSLFSAPGRQVGKKGHSAPRRAATVAPAMAGQPSPPPDGPDPAQVRAEYEARCAAAGRWPPASWDLHPDRLRAEGYVDLALHVERTWLRESHRRRNRYEAARARREKTARKAKR